MPRKFSTRKFSTKKLIDLPLTSGYFNQEPHGPAKGYVQDPAISFVLQERKRYNSDEKDKELFEQLERESNLNESTRKYPQEITRP